MDAEKLSRLLAIREAKNNLARQKGTVISESERPELSAEQMEDMDLLDYADRQAFNLTGDEEYLPKMDMDRSPASEPKSFEDMSEEEAREALKMKMLEALSGR